MSAASSASGWDRLASKIQLEVNKPKLAHCLFLGGCKLASTAQPAASCTAGPGAICHSAVSWPWRNLSAAVFFKCERKKSQQNCKLLFIRGGKETGDWPPQLKAVLSFGSCCFPTRNQKLTASSHAQWLRLDHLRTN